MCVSEAVTTPSLMLMTYIVFDESLARKPHTDKTYTETQRHTDRLWPRLSETFAKSYDFENKKREIWGLGGGRGGA